MSWTRLIAFASVATCVACTDTSLVLVGRIGDRIGLRGEFCTSEPEAIPATTRFLFLIDHSGSMRTSDPASLRFTAVQKVLDKYKSAGNVQYAMALFGDDEVIDLTTGFTNDQTRIADALVAAPDVDYKIHTDYEEALEFARTLIERDARALGEGEHVDYVVELLTDSAPNAGFDPQQTFDHIIDLVEAVSEAPGAGNTARLDALFIAAGVSFIPIGFASLLQTMAEGPGHGRYVQVAFANEIVDALPDLAETDTWIEEFEVRQLFVLSRNVVVATVEEISTEPGNYVDTDGDGLADEEELILGTDPSNYDTDDDGVSDLIERREPERNPLWAEQFDHLPTDALDEDMDGLNGIEERLLGLAPDRPDTDDDGIPDGVEVRAGTNPNLPDAGGDYDHDGFSNLEEARTHTSPRIAESDELRAALAYTYGAIDLVEQTQGRECYSFSVNNVQLSETAPLEPGRTLGGLNEITLYVLDTPKKKEDLTHHACESVASIIYRDGMRDPNRIQLDLNRHDFCE